MHLYICHSLPCVPCKLTSQHIRRAAPPGLWWASLPEGKLRRRLEGWTTSSMAIVGLMPTTDTHCPPSSNVPHSLLTSVAHLVVVPKPPLLGNLICVYPSLLYPYVCLSWARTTKRHPVDHLSSIHIPPCLHYITAAIPTLADQDQLPLKRWWFLFLPADS